jgi:hypothetical protein
MCNLNGDEPIKCSNNGVRHHFLQATVATIVTTEDVQGATMTGQIFDP